MKSKYLTAQAFIMISLAIALFFLVYLFYIQKSTIKFELSGAETIVLNYGETYYEQGFNAESNNNNISELVSVKSNVKSDSIGEYTVEYTLSIGHLNFDKTLVRKVIIKDAESPKIEIDSDKKIKLYIGEEFKIPVYTATDNVDKDVTSKVKVESNINNKKEGLYEVIFSVSDSSGNNTTEKIDVEVIEKRKDAHIDISIAEQKLRYYEKDKLVLESDIVSGIYNKTPRGEFKVLNKSRNTYLKGRDYVSFVNYWIAFNGTTHGMHDASWRNKFGGEIYKTNGSHGCVNMPKDKVKALYDLVEIGTKVSIA